MTGSELQNPCNVAKYDCYALIVSDVLTESKVTPCKETGV